MPILTTTDHPFIRATIDVELITKEVLPQETIEAPNYQGIAELEIRERVSRLSTVTASNTLAEIQTITQFNDDQILKLRVAAIRRVAGILVPAIRQREAIVALEVQDRYVEIDWEKRAIDLINESDDLLMDLDEGIDVVPCPVLNFSICSAGG